MAAPFFEIASIVRDVIADSHLELSPAARFDDPHNWNSMDLITVVVGTECRYNLQFDPQDIARLDTIGDLLHMIQAKQAVAAA